MNPGCVAVARTDFRALLPVWAAAVLTMLAEPLLRATPLSAFPLGMFAYVVGAVALGAHAIGHEYTNRTLATLFAQPLGRSSILITKAVVLTAMLAGLGLVAWPVVARADAKAFSSFGRQWQLVLPLAGGLFVAPYLTMKMRSQMAGAVFTASIPGTVWLAVLLAGITIHGAETEAADRFAFQVWAPVMILGAAAGAWLSVRSFVRLETIEGGLEELQLPGWLSALDRNPVRPPLWMLVKKELRLQQMTFALAGLYAVIWAAVTAVGRLNPEFAREFPIEGVGMLYFALLPLLIGSLASAQERQFGTFQSQAMLPVSSKEQWLVKAGVVLCLALVLGVLLPWTLFAPPSLAKQSVWQMALVILLLTSWSVYLSSWSPSGIVALALTLPATAAAIVSFRFVDDVLWRLLRGPSPIRDGAFHLSTTWANGVFGVVTAALACALLYFAGSNHRQIERRIQRLAAQAAWLLGLVAAGDLLAVLLLS